MVNEKNMAEQILKTLCQDFTMKMITKNTLEETYLKKMMINAWNTVAGLGILPGMIVVKMHLVYLLLYNWAVLVSALTKICA